MKARLWEPVKIRYWEPLTARYGVYQPVALVCSNFGIILSMSVLSWLWHWRLNDDPQGLRSKSVHAGRTTSAIVICSALLQTCLAVQLGTCCMMMATLAFEHKWVLLQDAAAMSIYRYSANAPYSMILPVLRGTRLAKNPMGVILLALLSCMAIVSQFVSTIFVSDMNLGYIAGRKQNVSLGFTRGARSTSNSNRPNFANPPGQFPWFAERVTRDFSLTDNATGHGIRDTGPTVRALLPLSSTKSSPFLEKPIASGQLEADGSFERNQTTLPPLEVNCDISGITGSFLCRAWRTLDDSFDDPRFPLKNPNKTTSFYDELSIYNTTSYRQYNERGYKFNMTEWTSKSVSGAGNITADITLCVTTFSAAYGVIKVKAGTNVTEPQYQIPRSNKLGKGYHNNARLTQGQLVARALRHKLGIFNLTNYERYGIEPGRQPGNWGANPVGKTRLFGTPGTENPVVVPTTIRGLFIVWGIVGLHFLMVAMVSWLFFKSSAPKFLDQAWQTVGQLQCGDAKEFLDYTRDLGDREVALRCSEVVNSRRNFKECDSMRNYKLHARYALKPLWPSSLIRGAVGGRSLTSRPIQRKKTARRSEDWEDDHIDLNHDPAIQIRPTPGNTTPTWPLLRRKGTAHSTDLDTEEGNETDSEEEGAGGEV
ncbi:hypothetical protein K440DRAFT_667496 [Wilcoxina mikolae CBS 423.85]|nr:hypothetical protein K440DRAFT_667496 [Wilcoxina mikolae CBS 423.85]